jgi:CelD/BcsL family acetyltransferase involved in cellulose biosynthesis
MNVAVLRPLPHETSAAEPRFARVALLHDFREAEAHWRALERGPRLATPYQSYDWLKAWQDNIGQASGVTPFIVVGFDAKGSACFLWPLGRRHMGGVRSLEFLGGKHANFNMALWRSDLAADVTADDLRSVLAMLDGEADLLTLINQPLMWSGRNNPFALLPHQASPSSGYRGALTADFDALLAARTSSTARRKMKKKEKKFSSYGAVTFERAESDAEVARVLEDFFAQKTARMRAIGLPNVFEAAEVQRFIGDAALARTAEGAHVIELYTLSLDGTIVATMGGVAGDGRFSAMFTSIIHEQYGAESVGEQLLLRVVRAACERGFHTFDLGIGEAIYKGTFCPDIEAMFDSYWPLTPAGRLAAFAIGSAPAAKRSVKQSPALWAGVQAIRRLRAKFSGKA